MSEAAEKRLSALRRGGPFTAIWVVTALLFLVSPLLADGALSKGSLNAMLPFAGVLAIAAIGQTLVIQQGGLDLSVPGIFSLGVALVVIVPGGDSSMLPLGLLVAVGAGVVAGLANGLAVTWLGITPLVATLGMNAILLGAEQQITGGSINYTATSNWDEFVSTKILGVSILAIIAAIAIVVVAIVMRRSVWGREFELTGANPRAARAAGLPVNRYQLGSYVIAGACYALAGALLAGYLGRPQLGAGNEYLLPTIAVVVLGGTALGGGRGSVVATAGGVLFLAQLDQLLQVLGVTEAVQLIIQGVIVALGMGLRSAPWRALLHVGSRHREGPGAGSNPRPAAPVAEPGVPTGAPSS